MKPRPAPLRPRAAAVAASGLAWLVLATPASAAAPVLSDINPRGAQRGQAAEVVLTGTGLGPSTRLLLPFPAVQTLAEGTKLLSGPVRLRLTIDPRVPVGTYPVRAINEDGISGLLFFGVDAFPNVTEVEDNSSPGRAQRISLPVVVTGQCAGGDVDYYRFAAARGQRVVVETEAARIGSGVVPQLRVTDAAGRLMGADDSQAVHGDCRVIFTAPAAGDYLVEISDSRYRGGNPPVYRLKIGTYDVPGEVFPLGGRRGDVVRFTLRGGTLAAPVCVRARLVDPDGNGVIPLPPPIGPRPGAVSPTVGVGDVPEQLYPPEAGHRSKAFEVTVPATVNGRIGRNGQVDRVRVAVKPGQRLRLRVQADTLGSLLDPVLRVIDAKGNNVSLAEDVVAPTPAAGAPATRSLDPAVQVVAPAGSRLLTIELRDQGRRGGVNYGYRLTIEPATADFLLTQPAGEVNVPRGGSVALPVSVTRRGYAGPLQLTVPDLPPGLSAEGGHVPAGGTAGLLTVSARTPGGPPVPARLRIEGRATAAGEPIVRTAEQPVAASADGDPRPLLVLRRFALAVTRPEPFAVVGPTAVEVVQGYATPVPVRVSRAAGQAGLAIQVTGAAPPATPVAPGQPAGGVFTFTPGSAAPGAASASFQIGAALTAPEGTHDIAVQATARAQNADRTVTGPAVAVTIRKPFEVVLEPTRLTLTAGQAVALGGVIRRHPRFKEPVRVRLDGLPPGVRLERMPAPVSPGQAEFRLRLKADPNAAAAKATLTAALSARVGSATYSYLPLSVALDVVRPPAKP